MVGIVITACGAAVGTTLDDGQGMAMERKRRS